MTRDFQTHPRGRGPALGTAIGVAVGALALLLSSYFAIRARHAEVRAREVLEEERRELLVLKLQASSRQSEHGGIEETVASQAFLSAEAPPPVLMAALEKALPADVRLTSLSLQYGRQLEVEMRVIARRPQAYDEFLSRLAGASFHDVVPAVESREDGLQATVRARFGRVL